MKKIGILLIALFALLTNVNAETFVERVDFVKCVDGDTAVFKIGDEDVRFRFLAIDTPETVHPTKAVEEYGKDASEYTCNKLTNAKEIIVEYEEKNKTDKYGRSLAWIWVDGSLLQKELISAGYAEVAYVYGKYRYTESLCLVQSKAKKEKLGIWYNDKEEGYCSTIDTADTEDNIIYEQIEEIDPKTQKTYDTLKKIDKVIIGIYNKSLTKKGEYRGLIGISLI